MVLPPQAKKALFQESAKKLGNLIDPINLPSNLREFTGGQSQMSRLKCFIRVWSYIKDNNLQDPRNRNLVNCDDKLRSIFLGKNKFELSELPGLVKLHFPAKSK
ncbi:upstream activation factor subunit spp27 [Nymphaea colorata]|nr:upstream activation factor subunit spp27 [Nymphaea colorata]